MTTAIEIAVRALRAGSEATHCAPADPDGAVWDACTARCAAKCIRRAYRAVHGAKIRPPLAPRAKGAGARIGEFDSRALVRVAGVSVFCDELLTAEEIPPLKETGTPAFAAVRCGRRQVFARPDTFAGVTVLAQARWALAGSYVPTDPQRVCERAS